MGSWTPSEQSSSPRSQPCCGQGRCTYLYSPSFWLLGSQSPVGEHQSRQSGILCPCAKQTGRSFCVCRTRLQLTPCQAAVGSLSRNLSQALSVVVSSLGWNHWLERQREAAGAPPVPVLPRRACVCVTLRVCGWLQAVARAAMSGPHQAQSTHGHLGLWGVIGVVGFVCCCFGCGKIQVT